MELIFNTPYKRIRQGGEKNSGEIITESAGYIPAKIQIENLIDAGMRLIQSRRENFDYGNDDQISENITDPNRIPNFDMADASALIKGLEQTKIEKEKEQSFKKSEELKKKNEKMEKDALELEQFRKNKEKIEENE